VSRAIAAMMRFSAAGSSVIVGGLIVSQALTL